MLRQIVTTVLVLWTLPLAGTARAQQRPLVTEDPESIGAGRLLIEGGLDYSHDQVYPASGLIGNAWRVPVLGVSIGISSIAEVQIDGGFNNRLAVTGRRSAPLSGMLTFAGPTTRDVEDLVVATKVRFAGETAGRPAFGVRFATRLPNASNESGLGLDTFDFLGTLLVGKTVRSIRVVGNVGVGILGDPTRGDRQNDVLTYGISVARAVTSEVEIVGEINGRASTRGEPPPPGTESRSMIRGGARYTRGAWRLDGGLLLGITTVDPSIGLMGGFTYVLNAFSAP